jgi:gamma-glutamyl-gamma-aminobutyrate hydrolase PuuD
VTRRVGFTTRTGKKAAPYRAALEAAGLTPVQITPAERTALDGLYGLVLCGGSDVNPALYGEPPHPLTEHGPDDGRDGMECELLDQAIRRELPVLGICRGMQLINVHHGGSLIQHLETAIDHSTDPPKGARHIPVHPVELDPASLLASITASHRLEVNSRHHQAVGSLGAGLQVTAWAPDGVAEALECPERAFFVAVQWHPEEGFEQNHHDRLLFAAFARAAGC